MNKYTLRTLVFLTLCCDMGLFAKRLIAPVANIITDFIRIPGGIGTSFSLMFLVIAAGIVSVKGCATLMSFVQSMIALSLGMVGSMGALSPIGYVVPGIIIDIVFLIGRRVGSGGRITMVIANMLSAAAAGLTANIIVFHLTAVPLALYISVALISGCLCGLMGYSLSCKLRPILTATANGNVVAADAARSKQAGGKIAG